MRAWQIEAAIVTIVITLSSACSGGGFFSNAVGGGNTARPSKPAPAAQSPDEDALDEFLSDEQNIIDALEDISAMTFVEVLQDLLSLFEEMGIDDREYTVKSYAVADLVSNVESLITLLEESSLGSLTIDEVLERVGGRDAVLDYGYESYNEDLTDNIETYADTPSPEEIVDNTTDETKRAAETGDTEIMTKTTTSSSKTSGKEGEEPKKEEPEPKSNAEEVNPICKANSQGKKRATSSAVTGFAVAVATTKYCKDLSEQTGRSLANDMTCVGGIIKAGLSAVATASEVLAKSVIDSQNLCSASE